MAPKPPGPPPPPPPGPPPPPMFSAGVKTSSAPDNRNALLSSIRQGAKLKKTVTVDKSGPYIPGKASSASNNGSPVGNGVRNSPGLQNGGSTGPPGLGGLFAGGMPKLRPTGKLAATTAHNGQPKADAPRFPSQAQPQRWSPEKAKPPVPTSPAPAPPGVSALSAALSEALASREAPAPREPPPARHTLKRHPSEVRARGPPPQPPVSKVMPLSSSDSVLTGGAADRVQSVPSEQGLPQHVASTLQRNKSSLHSSGQNSMGGSMTSLTSAPSTPTPASSLSTSDLSERPVTRVPSHGKPNLAPKPPTLATNAAADTRPSPPPKKLIVNGKMATRAQSMRVPRSPPVSPPSPQPGAPLSRPPQLPPTYLHHHIATKNPASHFGTLRAARGLRPPGVCPPPPPGAPPPPPPPARHASLAHHPPPPPPPPHHTSQNSTNGGSVDEASAPAPPVRGSSIRHSDIALDLEARFADRFHPVARFPDPDPFLRIAKGYSSATVAVSKAQAPKPPLSVPLDGWSGTSSAC